MTTDTFQALFEKYDAEDIDFEDVKKPRSKRKDMHVFLLLEELVPFRKDDEDVIISAVEHDQFWISTSIEKLAKVITEEQIRELVCCGVRFDEGTESLYMFV
jgi:hypothetical protein